MQGPVTSRDVTKLVIIGGGRMGEALLGGLLDAGWAPPSELCVVETSTARAEQLRDAHPGVEVRADPVSAEGALLAVKPAVALAAAGALAGLEIPRVVSIVAGVATSTLEAHLPTATAVVRAMPNTPALIGAGMTAIAAGTRSTEVDVAWAETLLGTVGTVVRVEEAQMDTVTGLSGSGPAYVFLFAEALIEAGVLNGLDRATARTLAVQTLLGAARLLEHDDAEPATLRGAVTSPGGTTAAGLAALEHARMRAAILDAVTAATERSRELG